MINWNKFWSYYEEASKKDYAKYKRSFMDAAQKLFYEENILNYNHGYYVKNKGANFSKKVRVYMLSNGVPDVAAKALITAFKKWINVMF